MGKSLTSIDFSQFTTNFTPEAAYFLGLIWADGYLRENDNSIRLECLQSDMDYFYKVSNEVGSMRVKELSTKTTTKQVNLMFATSKLLADLMKECDYRNKSKASPDKILKLIPDDLKHFFFLGWSDGDGCFYSSPDFVTTQFIMSGSYDQDWTALELLSQKYGWHYRITRLKRTKGSCSQFQLNRRKEIFELGRYLYSNHSIGLERKRDKYKRICEYVDLKSKIVCYDINTNKQIAEFESYKAAAKWVNKGPNTNTSIQACCVGRQVTCCGYKWKKVTYSLAEQFPLLTPPQ